MLFVPQCDPTHEPNTAAAEESPEEEAAVAAKESNGAAEVDDDPSMCDFHGFEDCPAADGAEGAPPAVMALPTGRPVS